MNKSVKNYKEYITDHILNVKRAFQIYGFMLCDELEVDFYEMQNQIDNHDKSKWSAEEFDPYMKKFFPDGPVITDYEFNKAWLHHIQYNSHHPEHWMFYDYDSNKVTIYDMPDADIIEMLCDWIAMGYKFNNTAYDYYDKNGNNKPLSDNTRFKVEYLLNKIKQFDINNNLQHDKL